jgi:hypothetical protein
MTEATDSLHQAQLRARLHRATITIALQRAQWAVKAKLQRQGLRVSQFKHRDLVIQAEAYLAEHREELIAEAKIVVEQWRVNGFFGKRAAKAFI